nr:pyridoxamine 5'-phosphate oxidase family protein [Micromonospora sp. DSM 115978]
MDVDDDTRRAIQAATVGELAWLDAAGQPQARPVTPLLFGNRPAVAFPYADAAEARRLSTAPLAALVVSDDRLTGRSWRPLAVIGRPHLTEDRDGTLFADRLLSQELRKYPPARALIDSPLLRREHWWYLPRLVLSIDAAAVVAVGARAGGAGEVMAVGAADRRLYVDTVDGTAGGGGQIRVTSHTGRRPPTGPAVLLAHDFSVPDLERWTPWTTHGWLADGALTVERAAERTALAPPLGLWRRLTRHRRLGRACRHALASDATR